MPRARSRISDERLLGVLVRDADELRGFVGRPALLEAPAGSAEVDGQRDQPRLRAVVEVALDLPPVARGGRDGEIALLGEPLRRLLELAAGRAEEAAHDRLVGPRQRPG